MSISHCVLTREYQRSGIHRGKYMTRADLWADNWKAPVDIRVGPDTIIRSMIERRWPSIEYRDQTGQTND